MIVNIYSTSISVMYAVFAIFILPIIIANSCYVAAGTCYGDNTLVGRYDSNIAYCINIGDFPLQCEILTNNSYWDRVEFTFNGQCFLRSWGQQMRNPAMKCDYSLQRNLHLFVGGYDSSFHSMYYSFTAHLF